MAEKKEQNLPERVTVLAENFPQAAMEFHRRNMSGKGYRMEGRIVPQQFLMVEGAQAPTPLFEGKILYAVTFVRKDV